MPLRIGIFTLLVIFISITARGQEVLSPLKYNTSLFYNQKVYGSNIPKALYRGTSTLLFFDDFSYAYKTIYPDTSNWMPNNQVFVNSTFPWSPPTFGVATFDGLNDRGMPYDSSGFFESTGGADTLTSRPIDLSSYDSSNNVFLSFFYQPQGYGDYPNTADSLVLEFGVHRTVTDSSYHDTTISIVDSVITSYGPDSQIISIVVSKDTSYPDIGSNIKKYYITVDSTLWSEQWSMSGEPLQPFHQVLIQLTDSIYFHSNFQFRFRNYATVNGDNDIWNIDYVKLGVGRDSSDTVLDDEAIQRYSTGILANYSEMPWHQFLANPQGELRSDFYSRIINNWNTSINDGYGYEAEELYTSTVLSNPPEIHFNFPALSSDSNQYSMYNINPLIALDSTSDSAAIKTTFYSYFSDESPPFLANDTIVQYQYFRNFYAYDDGSAEESYGVLGTGARGALRFHLDAPDSLQAVQIHWEHIITNQTKDLITLVVWKSLVPEVVLYRSGYKEPIYIDSLNGFATYRIDTPFSVSDTIYVGWLQAKDSVLDMGFDQNTDSHQNLFYSLAEGSPWYGSILSGSLMLHPVLGKRANVPFSSGIASTEISKIQIFPNPVIDVLRFEPFDEDMNFAVYSLLGTVEVTGETRNGTVNISRLGAGMYFIKLFKNNNQQVLVSKFIKTD